MHTYSRCLEMLQSLISIASYQDDNNVTKHNDFGTETFKIARAIKKLQEIEKEFLDFRNEIIKKHNPDNHTEVSDSIRLAIENDYAQLLATTITDLELPSLDYQQIFKHGNSVSIAAISQIINLIVNVPDEN